MMSFPDEKEFKSLVTLLDEDNPESLGLVRREILKIGEPIIPYLDEYRLSCASAVAKRVDGLVLQVRFRKLKEDFVRLSISPEPDLEEGALLVSRFGYPGSDCARYSDWLDKVAADVREGVPSGSNDYTVMQRLNNLLFRELKFAGNEKRYYDPDNTFLNRVIETRRGNPVTLSVLYLLIARRLGLPVRGIGTPGHFLVGFRESEETTFFIDAFHQGRLLSSQDVRRMLVRSSYKFRPEFLNQVSSREILLRMMRNLIVIYQKTGFTDRVELLSTLVDIVLSKKPRRP